MKLANYYMFNSSRSMKTKTVLGNMLEEVVIIVMLHLLQVMTVEQELLM